MIARLGWKQWVLICLPWVLIPGYLAARHQAGAPDHRLDGIRQAEADMQGSLAVGISYFDFQHKLQALASAVVLADQDGVPAPELAPHRKAIDAYMDSSALWKVKIDCPDVFSNEFSHCQQLSAVLPLATKYNVKYNADMPIPPLQDSLMKAQAFGAAYSPNAPAETVAQTKERNYQQSAIQYREAALVRGIYDLLMQTMWQQAAGVARAPKSAPGWSDPATASAPRR